MEKWINQLNRTAETDGLQLLPLSPLLVGLGRARGGFL